jgi:ribose transport system substrate-binding protein
LYVKYVATNNYNGGKMAAEHLLATLAKQGKKAPKLALFRYNPGSESTEQREKGFVDRIEAEAEKQKKADPDGPTVRIINDSNYAGATVDTAQKNAVALLNQTRDKVDGIFAVNESATNGLLNEMRSRELNKKILLMGFDSSGPLLAAVKDGDVIGLIVQDPYRMGYLGVWTLVRHLEGDDVSKGGKDLPTGEHLLTADNIDTDEIRQLFDPKLQVKRTIERPTFGKK